MNGANQRINAPPPVEETNVDDLSQAEVAAADRGILIALHFVLREGGEGRGMR